jgi:hypothetical protein
VYEKETEDEEAIQILFIRKQNMGQHDFPIEKVNDSSIAQRVFFFEL